MKNLRYKYFQLMKGDQNQIFLKNPKWQLKPKLHRYPTKRWGHTAVLSKSKLYIYGGKTGKQKEPIYELDCETFQSNILDVTGFPDTRESHSCSLLKDKLIIWGGCRQEKALNDCISITIKDKHCYWSQVAQFPTLKERESHSTTVLKDKYIFLYGGSNEDDMYEDFWVFNNDLQIWFEIKNIVKKFKKRLGCSLTTIKDKIYVFGGETEDQTYQNELYCLTFSEIQFSSKQRVPEMTCQLISPKNNLSPPGRSSHSAVSYQERYVIVIAGEGQGVDSKGKKASVLLNDLWSYDIQKGIWQSIQISNKNVFKPRSCFSANIFKNKIFIFGGLLSIQNFKSSDQLLVLSFSEAAQKNLETCNICKLHYQPIQAKPHQKQSTFIESRNSFSFGLNNLYKLARIIKNPFDAICLIIQAFAKMKYHSMVVDLIEGKIIMVQGQGIQIPQQGFMGILNKYEFVEEINSEDPLILSAVEKRKQRQTLQIFSYNIKNACCRLGQCFMMINRRGMLVDIMLVTTQNIFYCEYNTVDESVGNQQQRSYDIIKNYMHRNNLNISLIQHATFTIIITDLQRISPTQSQMKVNGKNFIQLTNSAKKISLHNYVSTLFLTKPEIHVSINNKLIQFRDYQAQYRNCNYDTAIQNDFRQIKIKESQKQQSIYVYRGGIRVGRFIKKNTPFIQGYIEISLHYQLNLLRHKLQNNKAIQIILQNICQQYEESSKKRKNHTSVYDLQQKSKNL